MLSPLRLVFLALALSALAACDNAEERAEAHFQSAFELISKGDLDRAYVEFRSVFKLNGEHREARATYAALQRQSGNYRAAIGQYLRLVEQYPDDLDGNRALAEMYAEIGAWDEIGRFLKAIQDIDPDDQVARSLAIVERYRLALEDRDPDAAKQAAADADALRKIEPDNLMLRQVLIDDQIRRGRFDDALTEIDLALKIEPDNKKLYDVRLSVLGALGDAFEIEAQLKDSIVRFPQDDTYRITLVRYYISQSQLDDAEGFLRAAIEPGSDDPAPRLTLIQFLTAVRGQDAALAELDNIIAEGGADPIFMSLRAGVIFDAGRHTEAIAAMEDLIATLDTGDEKHRSQVALAKMYLNVGDLDKSRALVTSILSEDKSHVDGLKLDANWLVDQDDTGAAIVSLRTALDQDPKDPEIFTLLARAHDREGNIELVGEMLALAVEASDSAPDPTVRYVQYLLHRGKFGPAESILIDALRRAPTHVVLLRDLGFTYLGLREWGRLEQVIATLRNMGNDIGGQIANDLQTRLLQQQSRSAEAVMFLEELVEGGDVGFDGDIAIVRTHFAQGTNDRAKLYLTEQLAERPGDAGLLFLDASVDAVSGRVAEAEATYRALIETDSSQIRVWLGLFRLLHDNDRVDDAKAVADAGIAAVPDAATLQWVRASLLEADGDIAGAVAIYEDMYAVQSSNLIVANNLASLLVELNQDPESVNRAYVISRRLRASSLPPYQDTYGWLAVLRGDFAEAVRALEPAAVALADDPKVQYHLARAYLGANSIRQAHDQFLRVLALTSGDDQANFVLESRTEVARLATTPEVAGSQ